MTTGSNQITEILCDINNGDASAAERLLPLVYSELRQMAGRMFRARGIGEKMIQPTIIVHDVFLKLAGNADIQWQNRSHFFAIAATAARDFLVDHARRSQAAKRGGDWNRVTLAGADVEMSRQRPIDMLELEDALNHLGKVSPRQEKVVEMRFFGGMTIEEIANVLGVSPRTVTFDWRMARAWLQHHLYSDSDPETDR